MYQRLTEKEISFIINKLTDACKELIDYYLITSTGSTIATKKQIREEAGQTVKKDGA